MQKDSRSNNEWSNTTFTTGYRTTKHNSITNTASCLYAIIKAYESGKKLVDTRNKIARV